MGNLSHKILVGTFHKTGSVLMSRIWREACLRLDLKYWPKPSKNREEPESWDVCFQDHSRFPSTLLAYPHRGFLVIRDPRDIIISGAHYHRHSTESWLHQPRADYDGLTYQEKINSLASTEERLLFEMNDIGGKTLREIKVALAAFPHFRVERFETLVTDVELKAYEALFAWAGFEGAHKQTLLQIAHKNSLFSGKVNKPSHVRSGKPSQWKTGFSERVMREFVKQHGTLAEEWGYQAPHGVVLPSQLED